MGQQGHKAVMHAIPQGHATQAARQPSQQKFGAIDQRNGALGQAKDPHHGATVQMARGKTARAQHNGYGAEQGREQRHQVEEVAGAAQCFLHAGAVFFQRLQAHTLGAGLRDLGPRPIGIAAHGAGGAHQRQAIVHAAGGLNQLGRGQIRFVHQHPWRKADQAAAPVRLLRQHVRNAQGRVAQPKRVAHLQPQGFEQGGFYPHLARLWRLRDGYISHAVGPIVSHLRRRTSTGCRCWIVRCILRCLFRHSPHTQCAAQRIGVAYRLEIHQPPGSAFFFRRARHGGKGLRRGGLQPLLGCLGGKAGRQRVVATHHQISSEQLRRIAAQHGIQPIREKGHGRQGGHRQGKRHEQQPQFARAHIAPQRAPSQAPESGRGRKSLGSRKRHTPHCAACGGAVPWCGPICRRTKRACVWMNGLLAQHPARKDGKQIA